MNSWNGIGYLGKDPEIKYSAGSQLAIASFSLAISRGKDKSGESKGTDWIRCKAFGKTAEVIEKYVRKGNQLGVTGHIQTGSYKNKNGDTVYTTDVIVDSLTFIKSQEQTPKHAEEQVDGFEAIDEDVPF